MPLDAQALSPAAELAAFAEARRAQGRTGRLIGLDLAGRDALFQEELAAFLAQVAAAEAQGQGEVEASGIALVDGGDLWRLGQGRWSRELSRHPGLGAFLAQAAQPPRPVGLAPLGPQLAALDEASWAPSATNGQPMRAWLLPESQAAAWRRLLGEGAWPAGSQAWLLVRKRKYDSLMGDVFEPFGLEVTAREESIDAGIFAAALAWGLAARGLGQVETVVGPESREAARALALEGLAALGPEAGPVAQELVEGLRSGARLVDALVAVGQASPEAALAWTLWPELVGARSTQRVASPDLGLDEGVEARLWAEALASLPPEAPQDAFRLVGFDRAQRSPAAIGQAMFDRLYGLGADPETRQGGEGGILAGATLANLLAEASRRQPGCVEAQLGEGWQALDEKALAQAAKGFAMGPMMLGPHLLARLGAEGRYTVEGDRLVDARGQALSAPVAVRLMKALAATFGRHFLAFQTTHPRNAVVLADDRLGDAHGTWRNAGRLAAALSYLARAEGLSAIVKTGPVDLAPTGVAEALAKNLDGLPALEGMAEGLRSGAWRPSFTFQVGWPLAGSERIGGPEGHDGFEERRRDKRPPRLGPEAFLLVP